MPTRRLLVLIAGNFFVATSFLSVGGLLSEISTALAIPIEQAGLLIAPFGISAAICAPTLATLGSRIDRRRLLTGSMAICALANALAALSHTYEQLLRAAVQQARLVAVAPPLAAATIAMNSSMTYLGGSIGATIGASAWTVVPPRFMSWVGLAFVLGALACSMLGERAARQTNPL